MTVRAVDAAVSQVVVPKPVNIIWESVEFSVDGFGHTEAALDPLTNVVDFSSINTILRARSILVSVAEQVSCNAFHRFTGIITTTRVSWFQR